MAQANQLMPGEWDNVFGPSAAILSKTQEQAFQDKTRLNAQLDPMALNYNSRVNMGRQIGKDINSLFGGKSTDPALRKAEIIDQIFKTLSPEELKNPALALSTIADRLEEQGYPRDAAEARMKSTEIAQQTMLNEDTVKTSSIKRQQAVLERIAQGANGILGMYDQVGPELQDQLYNQQVDMIEKEVGVEAANQLRNVKPTERKAMLKKMVDEADKESSRSKETIANDKISAAQKAYEFKAGVAKAMQTEKENNKFILQANDLKFKASKTYLENLGDRINATDDALKNQADLLEMYSDPMKTPTLSASERTIAINQITNNMKTLEATKGKLNGMQATAGQVVRNPVLAGPGSIQSASTSPTGTKTEYETDYANAQAALQRPGANKQAILDALKAKYPDQPQPTATTVTPTPGATPVANPAAPAAVVPPKPQTEAERREQIFLERLNDRTPLEVMQDVGSSIAGGFQQGEKYFQEKRDAFNKDIDIAASVAKEKLKDKTFVSKLSERQLKRLNEIANDSGAKHKAYQDSDTPYDALPLAGLSSIITKSASSILNKGSKILAAKAVKDATRTPSDIESNMAGLQDRLKRVEELERARKLRKIGDSDKEVLRQIKEEIKLIDQANESALKESLKNAETTAQRKLAMEQRKRLADIRKEIKRVFSIAGSTPVPYKKPEFN